MPPMPHLGVGADMGHLARNDISTFYAKFINHFPSLFCETVGKMVGVPSCREKRIHFNHQAPKRRTMSGKNSNESQK